MTPQVIKAAASIGGEEELYRAIENAPPGTPFAFVGIDNLLELVSRLGDQQSDHYLRFFRTVERLRGIKVFQLAPYKFAVVGTAGRSLDKILARLVSCPIRDRTRYGRGRATLSCSIVTEIWQPGMSLSSVLAEMRAAVHMLQREGGGQMVELRGPELPTLEQAGAIRAELVDAIGQGQLTIQLQPKIRTGDGGLIGAEVLVRWQSPRLGMLSPVTFIPILERAGLLHHVTDWVIRQAAECQVELGRRGLPAHLAVNIGANEFDHGLPARLCQICEDVGADPKLFELEITETTLMDDLAMSGRVIDELRKHGVRIALDDFGTGYSSLSYLSGCHVDALKIDRSFITAIASNRVSQKVVEGIISLGTKLGVEVVAEGVETREQMTWLAAHGCHVVQGYLYSIPLTPDAYYEYCGRGRSTSSDGGDFDFVI
jgi:EAL domain-containing protein (putative c-di-GMP-specific phosphodiesterase class I)